MQAEGGDKIVKTMKKVCEEQKNGEKYFDILKEIYNHIFEHENEPFDSRAQSISDIIDSKWEGSGCHK